MDFGFYRNSWYAENFQEPWNSWSNLNQNNENPQPWRFWPTGSFQERRNDEFLQTRSLCPAATFQQTETGKHLTPRSSKNAVAFQKVKNNENQQNSPKYISKDFIPRKRYRKNRSRQRLNPAINGNLVHCSPELVQQGYQGWNQIPVLDWSQSNLYPQPNIQNSFRRYHDKNACTFQNSYSNKPVNKTSNTSTNFVDSNHSNVTSGNAVSCANFKPSNSGSITSNNFSNSSISSYNSNGAAINESKKSKLNSSNFNDFSKPNDDDDDIAYLFSVDSSSEKKMVLEVDLQSNSTNLISKSSKGVDHPIKQSKGDTNADQSKITLEGKHDLSKSQISRKRKSPEFAEKNRKRACYQPTCESCKMCYDDIIQNREDMYISSSCGHIFCRPCISKYGNTTVCPNCGIKCSVFRRLYI